MQPLSVVIIARDEADRLPRAVASVAGLAEEVLVLDSGSTDGTPDVARSLGARVIQTDWPGHVAQKNRGLEAARHPWILSLDADEQVSPELASSIRRVLDSDPPEDGFTVARRNFWLDHRLTAGGWYPDRRLRLVRRAAARWTGTDPHDRLVVDGATAALAGDLHHHPYRDLGEHLATLDRYTRRFAEVSRVRARWWDVALRPPWRFFRGYVLQRGFVDGVPGFLVALLGATYTGLKWGRLYLRDATGTGSPATTSRATPPGVPDAVGAQEP